MSIKVTSQIWEKSRRAGTDLLILLALADCSDDEGLSFPDIDDIAHKARLSVEDTRTQLAGLVSQGVLKKIENVGSYGADYYQILEVQQHVR